MHNTLDFFSDRVQYSEDSYYLIILLRLFGCPVSHTLKFFRYITRMRCSCCISTPLLYKDALLPLHPNHITLPRCTAAAASQLLHNMDAPLLLHPNLRTLQRCAAAAASQLLHHTDVLLPLHPTLRTLQRCAAAAASQLHYYIRMRCYHCIPTS